MKENDRHFDNENRLLVTLTIGDFESTVRKIINENIHLIAPTEVSPKKINKLVPRLSAANSYGICPETLDKWEKLGIFPKRVKKGGRVYFYQSDLDTYNTKNIKIS